jgi:allophanate hydrolase subunit 2
LGAFRHFGIGRGRPFRLARRQSPGRQRGKRRGDRDDSDGRAFEFEADTIIALTGSDFGAGLPLWTPVEVKAGQTLRCGPSQSGARCYLCVRGGIGIPKTMGSASTHIITGVGGRPLRAGDLLPIGKEAIRRPRPVPKSIPPQGDGPLRVTDGPQTEAFADDLYRAAYTVSEESNRMGLRLRGPAIRARPAIW